MNSRDLFAGRFKINGRPLALGDIRVPSFVVATETDHVAPWHSVYKLNLAIGADVTFLLTSGGHNAGITSEPGHPHRRFRVGLCPHGENYIDPERWLQITPSHEGSWWPAWAQWLERGQSKRPAHTIAPPDTPGLPAAPGHYVRQT